jgi:hypothetical protein
VAEKIRDLRQLREKIGANLAPITTEMLQPTYKETEYLLGIYRTMNGVHIEAFYGMCDRLVGW